MIDVRRSSRNWDYYIWPRARWLARAQRGPNESAPLRLVGVLLVFDSTTTTTTTNQYKSSSRAQYPILRDKEDIAPVFVRAASPLAQCAIASTK